MSDDLVRLEAAVAHAMLQPDPATALAAAAEDQKLPAELRDALRAADPDGVRIAALIVVRLRFERTLNGSQLAGEWFERDGAAFTAAFKRYHAEVPPSASLPSGEGRLFEAWLERQGDAP